MTKGNLHPSAYEPRKPRQWSNKTRTTRVAFDGYDEDARGNLPLVGTLDPTGRDARLQAKLRDGNRCRFCGDEATTTITLKHINKGGTWDLSNVARSCSACDLAGRMRSIADFDQKRNAIRRIRRLEPDP